jgi:hypothetical protein
MREKERTKKERKRETEEAHSALSAPHSLLKPLFLTSLDIIKSSSLPGLGNNAAGREAHSFLVEFTVSQERWAGAETVPTVVAQKAVETTGGPGCLRHQRRLHGGEILMWVPKQ